MPHAPTLAVAYAAACAAWWGVRRIVPLWPDAPRPRFEHPWREVAFALAAVVVVLLLGQLWVRGIRLRGTGVMGWLAEALNQIVIFAPLLAVPLLRRHGWASAWVRPHALWVRVAIGVALSQIALIVVVTLEAETPGWAQVLRSVYAPAHAPLAVQVLLEDLAIAILLVRLAAAVGPRVAIPAVAALFAAAHLPALLAGGDVAGVATAMLRDAALGVLVLVTVWRGADVAWLWPVHFALDMTQFLT